MKSKISILVGIIVVMLFSALVILPPFLTMDSLRPQIESAVSAQTGMNIKINGNVRMSLIGRATITATDIMMSGYGGAKIESASFYIPYKNIFNPGASDFSSTIIVRGADLNVTTLVAPEISARILLRDSFAKFHGVQITDITGAIDNGGFTGTGVWRGHKLSVTSDGQTFVITNPNLDLTAIGQFYTDDDGKLNADGNLKIDTHNADGLFSGFFDNAKLNINFEVIGTDFIIKKISGRNRNFEFSGTPNDLMMIGKIKYALPYVGEQVWNNFKISDGRTVASNDKMSIISNPDRSVAINFGNYEVSITPDGDWTYDDMFGSANFPNIEIKSDTVVTTDIAREMLGALKIFGAGDDANITFPGGAIEIKGGAVTAIQYKNIQSKLSQTNVDPRIIKIFGDDIGTVKSISFQDSKLQELEFISDNYELRIVNHEFIIKTDLIKLLPGDAPIFLAAEIPATITGTLHRDYIDIKLLGMTGRIIGNTLDIKTPLFDMDKFINAEFFDDYENEKFLSAPPIAFPFDLGFEISVNADTVKIFGETYSGFLYSANGASQKMSISDDARGNLMLFITRRGDEYLITAQAGKFIWPEKILPDAAAINLSDTVMTLNAELETFGLIAADFDDNLAGDIEITFHGGTLHDFGTDDFFARAGNLDRMNAEMAIARALDFGTTKLKTLTLSGIYADKIFDIGNFDMSTRHTEMSGRAKIANGRISINADVLLRGTSPAPKPIRFELLENGTRRYSLEQIMSDLDPDYMREFVKTHDRF
ncbi:MAG: AsmA family protein [Rickettsiales bacterium]|jgi:hypothetical protein|nr:AsmA family protein [Rickettsiales bacterium]